MVLRVDCFIHLLLTDIDECDGINDCGPNAHCVNIPGAHICKCNEGFEGNGLACTGTYSVYGIKRGI